MSLLKSVHNLIYFFPFNLNNNNSFQYLYSVSLQYDFPKQEAVIQFVIDAIQAETFNPKTLFLIGSYTIGRFGRVVFLWYHCPITKKLMRKNKKIFSFRPYFHLFFLGKERIFLEVARALSKKVHVTAAKLRLLKCLEFKEEDMKWFTSNEHESNIHVAPMWTLASFKRLKQMSSQYTVSVAAGCHIETLVSVRV